MSSVRDVEKLGHAISSSFELTTLIDDKATYHGIISALEEMSSKAQKGDTIFRDKDRWRTKCVTKEVHDTVYKARVDSIPVPYPVEKQVPAELTWWQQTRIKFANVMIYLAILIFVVWLAKKKLQL